MYRRLALLFFSLLFYCSTMHLAEPGLEVYDINTPDPSFNTTTVINESVISTPSEEVVTEVEIKKVNNKKVEKKSRKSSEETKTLSPEEEVLSLLNKNERKYPGIDAAVVKNDFLQASKIIFTNLKQRRIIKLVTEYGPGATRAQASAYEWQDFNNFLANIDSVDNQDYLSAATRLDKIIDYLESPLIELDEFSQYMRTLLLRLNEDLNIVATGLETELKSTEFLILTRPYMRALIFSDFFNTQNTDVLNAAKYFFPYFSKLFYRDGSSIAGDTGGITSNVFLTAIMLGDYAKSLDSVLQKREIHNLLKYIERPAWYIQNIAYPTLGLPLYGPRSKVDLTAVDVAKIAEIFPLPVEKKLPHALQSFSYPKNFNDLNVAGLYVAKSSNEPGARYSAIRFGPLGTLDGAPAHYDFGSISIVNQEIAFVVDAGGFAGKAAETMVHNILTLDGEDPTVTNYPEAKRGEAAPVWRSNLAFDYVADIGKFSSGKSWKRDFVYIKNMPGESFGDYWFVKDRVLTAGDSQEKLAKIRFKLAPNIEAYHDGAGMLATASYGVGPVLRFFAIDADAEFISTAGDYGDENSYVYNYLGDAISTNSLILSRTIAGDTDIVSLIYPGSEQNEKPVRIERDYDIVKGRTGLVVVDHGLDRLDILAWTPPDSELVTPTLDLQLDADFALFRIRRGKIVRASFVNLKKMSAKDPAGGLWEIKVNGNPSSLVFEMNREGGYNVISDLDNTGAITLDNVRLGSVIADRKIRLRPGEIYNVIK